MRHRFYRIVVIAGVLLCRSVSVVLADPPQDVIDAIDRGDYTAALGLLRPLAEGGNRDAQVLLGTLYDTGKGITPDYAQAAKWYELAAVQGNALAQSLLGLLYGTGKGVPTDFVSAYAWLNMAAASLTGDAGQRAAQNRNDIANFMTPQQIGLAQAIARQCELSGFRNCAIVRFSRALPSPTQTVAPASKGQGSKVIHLEVSGGTYAVPVLVNGVMTLRFTVDSGAADVSIPADVFSTLLRTGTISDADFLGQKTYILADGSKIPSQTFQIHSLKIGDITVENVLGSIAPPKGDLLLGQSFLSRLHSWSMDNRTHTLIIE